MSPVTIAQQLKNAEAKLMDIILLADDSFISKLICYSQKIQNVNKKPSQWSHVVLYMDESTLIESTIDLKKDIKSGKRLINGVQISDWKKYDNATKCLLLQFTTLTDKDREVLKQRAINIYDRGYTYPILGLLGSLLSYWVFRWKSNPLQSKKSLYCSAFVQEVYAPYVDFDPMRTARNTSPELISQYNSNNIRRSIIRI